MPSTGGGSPTPQGSMLQSMTGFGRAEATSSDVAVVVELRSVNNRFLDVQSRLPREYAALEPAVQRAIKAAFQRGRVDVNVRRQVTRTRSRVVPDSDLFHSYVAAIDGLLQGRSEREREHAAAFALGQPGVLTVSVDEVDVLAEEGVLLAAVESAIADLAQMRSAEGQQLAADLEAQVAALLEHVDAIEAHVADLDVRIRDRLVERMQRLLGDRVETWRLVQEAGILADKADVAEEVTRLRSHCLQFREAMARDEVVGRRLDFLVQEMNREVNTIGSKAVDHPVSHRVVDMKAVLERMREQAANVE